MNEPNFAYSQLVPAVAVVPTAEALEEKRLKQLKWDKYYLSQAKALAETFSYDPKFKVGSILVNNTAGTPCSQGYNGRGKGRPNERLSMDTGKSGFVHSEANCIAKAAWQYGCNYTLYVTLAPCVECAGLILNTPVKRVVFSEIYPADLRGIDELIAGLGVANVVHLPQES